LPVCSPATGLAVTASTLSDAPQRIFRPSCWLQPFALRTAHELLRARHLALNATQQITPLFDTQFPVLLTDIAVLNTFALATLPGYLRARWLLPAPYADRSAFDTWRSLLHADCSALFTLRPAMNPFHFPVNTCRLAANTDFSALSAQFPVPTADCSRSTLQRSTPISYRYASDALRSPRTRITSRSMLDFRAVHGSLRAPHFDSCV